MATRIRLQRKGRKGKPIYSIVIADQRSPRDGKFIEKIGTYNPNTNPAEITLNFDSALSWAMKGAQPSDSVRAILSYKGVLMKKHLLEGVRKGAFDEKEAEKRFNDWMEEKNKKISDNIKDISKETEAARKESIANEIESREKRKQKKESKIAEEAPAEEAPAEEEAAEDG